MEQNDLFGLTRERRKFVDIRNTRGSVAEEKAVLCRQLGDAINRVPPSVCNGSIQRVREWRTARDEAAKVAGKKRPSINELQMALKKMLSFR